MLNFALDAVVTDNGEKLHGSPAILAWIKKTMEEFGARHSEPLHLAESDGGHVVTARVSRKLSRQSGGVGLRLHSA